MYYMIYINFNKLLIDEKEIMISTGMQVASLAGSGGADYYQRKGEQYIYKSSSSHWLELKSYIQKIRDYIDSK